MQVLLVHLILGDVEIVSIFTQIDHDNIVFVV